MITFHLHDPHYKVGRTSLNCGSHCARHRSKNMNEVLRSWDQRHTYHGPCESKLQPCWRNWKSKGMVLAWERAPHITNGGGRGRGGPVWTLDGGIIFIGALYFFNMYCFILSSILFLFLFPGVAPLMNKWLVYLFLEHSISFQVSLGTAQNCSPLTCGGSKTTGFPPLWATFAVNGSPGSPGRKWRLHCLPHVLDPGFPRLLRIEPSTCAIASEPSLYLCSSSSAPLVKNNFWSSKSHCSCP